MRVCKYEGGYFLRLIRGEKVMATLTDFVQQEKIPAGTLSGIGAVWNTELGYYDLANKKYVSKPFPNEMELTSFVGNASYFEDKATIHAHVTLADTEFRSFSGHLMESEVAVTVEIGLQVIPARMNRSFDSEIGLNLLDL